MRKLTFCVLIAALAGGAVLAIVACSSSVLDSSSYPYQDGSTDGAFADGGPSALPGAPQLAVNGLVLVHAASFPAFRVCFENAQQDRPAPSTDVMPESNVVGVDVGTAVRLPAHPGVLGRAFVFPEISLRGLYPAFGGAGIGPTCSQLLLSNKGDATEVADISDDLSSGVHALILQGCRAAAADGAASTQRCGDDWTPSKGNLRLTDVPLLAFLRRRDMGGLPVQVLQLSPGLARKSAGRALGIGFGALDREGGAPPAPFIEGAVPFGKPVPNPPALLDYSSADLRAFATKGVFLTMGAPLNDAGLPTDAGANGPREVVLSQSLEDIQRRSASRSLPPDWFAVASSYVVLSVGDPDPRLVDGGPDDDARRALHLLAIPLAPPADARDGGADASAR